MDVRKVRAVLFICILVIFGIIFKFSSENSTKSTNTSNKVIDTIVDTHPVTKDLNEYQKSIVKNTLITPVRKLAHFTIYTLLGVFLMCFVNTYDTNILKKVLISLIVGTLYSCSDELHQLFVPGRSGQITDVIIDSVGVFTGILLVILQMKFVNWIKTSANNMLKYKKRILKM